MKLSNFKRIISTDFDEKDQPLIEKLGRNLNDGIDGLYFALNNKLTFEDNFLSTVKDVEVTVNSSGVPTTRTSILLNTTNVVKGTQVIATTNKTSATGYPTSCPFISYTQNGNTLFIDNITGLIPNNRYIIRFIAYN
jgi:hypothetical protein